MVIVECRGGRERGREGGRDQVGDQVGDVTRKLLEVFLALVPHCIAFCSYDIYLLFSCLLSCSDAGDSADESSQTLGRTPAPPGSETSQSNRNTSLATNIM